MTNREKDIEEKQIEMQAKRRLRHKRKRRKKRFIRFVIRSAMILAAVYVILFAATKGAAMIKNFLWKQSDLLGYLEDADVVLDAGHGGRDGGAMGGAVMEKDITLQIAEEVRDILENAGYNVVMTRDEDNFVDLHERAKRANKTKAKVFVSIHCNSAECEASGIETYYCRSKETSSNLAELLQNALVSAVSAQDRGIKTADYVVVEETQMPAVLTEIGFLSDTEERKKLQDPDYQEKVAAGIAGGIMEYLE